MKNNFINNLAHELKSFKLGADDYLVKPIDEGELVARIRAILNRSHITQEVRQNTQSITQRSRSS